MNCSFVHAYVNNYRENIEKFTKNTKGIPFYYLNLLKMNVTLSSLILQKLILQKAVFDK